MFSFNLVEEVNKMTKSKTHKVGRDAGNGQFITIKEANKRPNSTVIERVPNPGCGDTKPRK
jgi:hypothetical protein